VKAHIRLFLFNSEENLLDIVSIKSFDMFSSFYVLEGQRQVCVDDNNVLNHQKFEPLGE
jgi:hypothetical protein